MTDRLIVGVPPPPLLWPQAGLWQAPDSDLDYRYDAAAETAANADPIQLASAAVRPSGSDEIVLHDLSVSGAILTLWLRGGVAGRVYTVKLLFTTTAGRMFERFIVVPVDPTTAAWPASTPPDVDFGTPVTWSADDVILGINGDLLLGTS